MKSLEKTKTVRPLTVPQPVTTPSPGMLVFSMPKSVAAVLDEHVELLERALVEQQLDALARGQLALGVLRLDAPLAAPGARLGAAPLQAFENLPHAGPVRWERRPATCGAGDLWCGKGVSCSPEAWRPGAVRSTSSILEGPQHSSP